MKLKIKNRKGQNIVVLVEEAEDPQGLAFVMHGLSGFKEQPHIATFAQAFKEKGYIVVRFDTTNSYGESEGKYEDATVTNYYEDLEDVINWAKTQSWYKDPFVLAGHSLGGVCTILYAQKYPEKVRALAPISSVISGKLSLEVMGQKVDLANWKKTGWREEESVSKPGVIKRLKWSHMEDRLKYDVLLEANKLTMPVLLMVGEKDLSTPLKHQQLLYDALPGKKEIHVIRGSEHTFRTREELEEVKNIFLNWIDTL